MISAHGVTKSFGAPSCRRTVLNGVTLEIERGEFVALAGRSGSGKSTLLHILAGLEYPDAGSVTVDGTEITGRDADSLAEFRLRRVGLVFQFFNFLPTLSLIENVALPAYLLGSRKRAANGQAAALLGAVGLSEAASRLPHEVSGGELQRAAIARAMVNEPAVLFADEPTGNLDEQSSGQVLELLRRLVRERGVTILMVTHDPSVRESADRRLSIADGVVLA